MLGLVRTYVVRQARAIQFFNMRTYLARVGENSSIGVSEVSLLPEAPDILAKDKIRKPQREKKQHWRYMINKTEGNKAKSSVNQDCRTCE